MWINRKRSPLHIFHRDRRRQTRRPAFEALERRDCPAVQAVFVGGVLTVVGDERNNVIELYQPRDRVVEVSGDGQTWVFEAVDKVFVDAGDGDDQATSSKPKEIVVVGSKIKMQMGAGSDTVTIDEGGSADSHGRGVASIVTIDLGEGNDAFSFVSAGARGIDLTLTAGGGDDWAIIDGTSSTFLVGEVLPSRMVIDLGAGNDDLNLHTKDLGDVEMELTAGDGDDSAQAHHELRTTALWGVRTRVSLGAGADRLRTEIEGYGDVDSLVDAGAGDDMIFTTATPTAPGSSPLPVLMVLADHHDFYLGPGDDWLVMKTSGYANSETLVDAGAGDDRVVMSHRTFAIADRTQLSLIMHLGAGSDVALLDGTGYRALVCVFYAGPAQDGRDFVAASFRLTPFERMRRIRQVTDGGMDLMELVVGAGYNVQTTSGNESITVILTRTEN
jgi:hypothetical protein